MNVAMTCMMSLSVCVMHGWCAGQTDAPHEMGPAPPPAVAPPARAPAPPPASGGEKFPWPEQVMPSAAVGAPGQEVFGSLAIRAVQGTPGGANIGVAPVEVDLIHRGVIIKTIRTQLDEHGIVVIEDLPVTMGVEPVVRVRYEDLAYQVAGEMMDPAHAVQQVEVTCFEHTDQQPAWKVQMRHVMMSEGPDGLRVTEVMVIENPGDRTWIGAPTGPNSRRVTTAFTLPAKAKNVTLGSGFHTWSDTTLIDGTLMNHLPLMPQVTQMIYSYVVPAAGGKADVTIAAPAAVDHLVVLIPPSLTAESVDGLQDAGMQTMGDTSMRSYMAAKLGKGERASITLTGLHVPDPVSAATGSESAAKIVAAIGGGLILLVGVAVVLAKTGKSSKAAAKAT